MEIYFNDRFFTAEEIPCDYPGRRGKIKLTNLSEEETWYFDERDIIEYSDNKEKLENILTMKASKKYNI